MSDGMGECAIFSTSKMLGICQPARAAKGFVICQQKQLKLRRRGILEFASKTTQIDCILSSRAAQNFEFANQSNSN
jgi:hypothetical protein